MTTISTSSFYDNALSNFAALKSQVNTLQAQISTGNKLAQASDDPVAAAQLRVYARQDAAAAVDVSNANSAQANLTLASTAMTTMIDTVDQIQTLATQAASSTVSDSQRANIGTQIAGLQQDLLSLANSQDTSGHALFGGETAGPAYTTDAAGNAAYAGTASAAETSLGGGLHVTGGITAPEFLNFTSGGKATDLLSTVKALGDALQAGTGGAAAAHAALAQLSDGLNALSTGQTLIGTRLAWITATNTVRTQISQQRTQDETNLGSTDITAAVTKLSQTTTALQASQDAFVKLSGLSLFAMIQP